MVIRDVPSFGLYMLTYEYLYIHISESQYSDNHGVVASLFGGGVAGLMSWAVVHPFDVVKSIYQADQGPHRKTIWKHTQELYMSRGYKAFFAGMTMNCVRAFPVNAVTFLVYSQSLKYLCAISNNNPVYT